MFVKVDPCQMFFFYEEASWLDNCVKCRDTLVGRLSLDEQATNLNYQTKPWHREFDKYVHACVRHPMEGKITLCQPAKACRDSSQDLETTPRVPFSFSRSTSPLSAHGNLM